MKHLIISLVILVCAANYNILHSQDKELSMYRFTFGNRYYMNGDKISKKEFSNHINAHAPSKKLHNQAKTNKYIAIGFNIAQLSTVFGTFDAAIDNDLDRALYYLYANVALGAFTIYFNDLNTSYTRRAIHEYNHQSSSKPKFTVAQSPAKLMNFSVMLDGR